MIVDKFDDAQIEAYEREVHCDFDHVIKPCVEIRITSKALYHYYTQMESTREYFAKLPPHMRDGFIPYKTAMEQQLQHPASPQQLR